MRFFNTLGFVLILAGISNVSKAQEGAAILQKSCLENSGGPKAYDDFEQNRRDFLYYAATIFRNNEVQVEKHCSQISVVQSIIKNLTESTKKCWNTTEQATFVDEINFLNSASNFICNDGKSQYEAFLASRGNSSCLITKAGYAALMCNENFSLEKDVTLSLTGTPVPKITEFLKLDSKEFDEYKHCYVNSFKGCGAEKVEKLVGSLLDYARADSGSESNASSTKIINILLLVIAPVSVFSAIGG